MKKWKTPEVEELSISCTEQGKNLSSQYDEIRVDQKQGFRGQIVQLQIPSRVIRGNVPDHRHVEAIDSNPDIDGDVTVH